MSLFQRIPISSSSFRNYQQARTNLSPISCLNYETPTTSSASSSSPFTEKDSAERYQRDQWLYKAVEPTPPSTPQDEIFVRENDIASQLPELPELKKLLAVLREKRVKGCKGSDCGDQEMCILLGQDQEILSF